MYNTNKSDSALALKIHDMQQTKMNLSKIYKNQKFVCLFVFPPVDRTVPYFCAGLSVRNKNSIHNKTLSRRLPVDWLIKTILHAVWGIWTHCNCTWYLVVISVSPSMSCCCSFSISNNWSLLAKMKSTFLDNFQWPSYMHRLDFVGTFLQESRAWLVSQPTVCGASSPTYSKRFILLFVFKWTQH